MENQVLRVAESKTRAGEGRPIPLTQPAWAALHHLAERFPGRHFVFPACENGQVDPSRGIASWRTAWRRSAAMWNAGRIGRIKNPLEGLRFHDLRHSTATKLLEQGTPFAIVAQILGWSASSAVRMAKRYGHIRPEAQRQALTGVATQEIQMGVNQFVHQPSSTLQSGLPN